MKANELMIGDLVIETEFDRNRPARIDAIVDKTRVLLDTCALFTPTSYIRPIPLAEILAKNFTFESESGDYWWSDGYIEVTITEYTDGLWEVKVDEIEMAGLPTWKMYVSHVHELQHALRLCGIDKTIEL